MTTVYAPNEPLRKHPITGRLVPSMDLGPALRFGTLVFLFSHDELQSGAEACERLVDARMRGVAPGDYILFIGDPALMAMVVRAHGRLLPGERMNLLRWDRQHRDYDKVSIK